MVVATQSGSLLVQLFISPASCVSKRQILEMQLLDTLRRIKLKLYYVLSLVYSKSNSPTRYPNHQAGLRELGICGSALF